jgi:hypothetical protein
LPIRLPRHCVFCTSIGGFAQFFCTLLTSFTGNPSAPALYLIVRGLVSLLGLVLVKEPTQR